MTLLESITNVEFYKDNCLKSLEQTDRFKFFFFVNTY